jgi:predicted O-methyltransferase YrrM
VLTAGEPPTLDGMPTTLRDCRVVAALDRMYAETREQTQLLLDKHEELERLPPVSAQERADAMSAFYMPVTPEAGRLLYSLVRAACPTIIVEFGMSFGISTIHLASAARDNGSGQVVTTELSAIKIAAAKHTFTETGLDDLITVLDGDALSTLVDVHGPVGFVLLDGLKELYLPVIKLLEPRLSPGALIVADNTEMAGTQPYLDYVRDAENGYMSVNFLAKESDTMEISCRI